MPNVIRNPQDDSNGSGSSADLAAARLDRPLALRRRCDIIAVPQTFAGRRLWAIKDPVALRYFHLTDEEYRVFEALDGSVSLADIQQKFERRFAPRRLTLGQLQSFLGQLHQEGLILADAPGQSAELLKRAGVQRRRRVFSALSNILAIRFRGIDPQRFLDWLLGHCRLLFSGWSLLTAAFTVLAAALLMVSNFDAVRLRLPEFNSFLNPSTVIWLSVALAVTKVLHELGHALTCRYFGGECHELGLMFLVFTPCLYCNVSDAWMIDSKWRRVAIGAAGVGIELVLASVCTMLWWFSEPGLLNTLCFNILLVSSVNTLLFNGNPLLRYDGYYILSDLVEIPNLAQTSAAAARDRFAEWLLGIPAHQDDGYSVGTQFFLVSYALFSAVYRTVVVVSILWIFHKLLKPHHLEAVFVLLAFVVVGGMAAPALQRAMTFVQQAFWSRQMQPRRAIASVLVVVSCLLALFLAPIPHRVAAPAVLEPENARRVYVSVAGTMAEAVEMGTMVHAGDRLALLTNLDLDMEVTRLRGNRDEQKLRLENLRRRQSRDSAAALQIPTAEEALADLEKRLQQRTIDEGRLLVKAPVAGRVLPVRRKPLTRTTGDLATWSGLPLDTLNRGCYLETGTLLCQIGDPARLEASLVLDQADIEFIHPGQKVQIQLDNDPGRLLVGTIREVAEINLKITPAELLPAGSIPTRPDQSGIARPISTVYQAHVELPPADTPLLIGQTGRAKIDAGWLSLAGRLSRFVSRTFRFEL